ncbi:MAG: hypothetical protein EPN94_11110 [Nitrospirae bacterium]|nr:MAG: hypothetical protein EPN94_11110 [Nitrospirota bacterium]
MHLKRLLIAFIALPLAYFYITKLPAGYFLFLLIAVSVAAQYEFYSMYKVKALLKYTGIVFGVFIILAFSLQPSLLSLKPFDLFAVLFIIMASIRLFLKRSPESSLLDIATTVTAVVYIPLLLGYQIYLRNQGYEWIIFLYGCVWASDSLAYYAGKGLGRKKLYEEISPNKTVAGAVGSIAGGAAGAVILKTVFIASMALPLSKGIILGIIIGAVTIIGDLVESMFKRDAGVKDSSNIFPGHGGLLDKLDGALFAGPVLYWVSIFLGLIQ